MPRRGRAPADLPDDFPLDPTPQQWLDMMSTLSDDSEDYRFLEYINDGDYSDYLYEFDDDEDDEDDDFDDEGNLDDDDDDDDDSYDHGIFSRHGPSPYQSLEYPTVDEVRARVEPMNKRIWNNYTHLQAIGQRFEAVIQRRWEKKSKVKRRETVLSAWGSGPAIAKEHRPELIHVRNYHIKATRKDCEAGLHKPLFFWSYLNLEDLCKTEPLLLLLNARVRNPPSVFAHMDLEHAHRGFKIDEVPYPAVLKDWSMRFLGRDTPETYGELVSWDEDPQGCSRLHRWRDVSPGEGLWILEIQDRLYQFLIDACRAILHDTDLTPATIAALPEVPEPALPTANSKGDALAGSLMTLRYESTYHVPSKFNLSRLQDIIASKLAAVEDTIWALREDPAFFITMLDEWYCHRAEMTLDTDGKQHPCLVKDSHREALTARLVGAFLSYYLPALEIWARMHDKIIKLVKLKDKLFDRADPQVSVDDDLPHELELAFCSLYFHLEEELEPNLLMIVNRAKWSPPMSYLFRRVPPRSSTDAIHGTLSGMGQVSVVSSGATPETGINGIETQYIWILHTIANIRARETFGLDTCVEEIDRISQHPQGKKLMTAHMQEMFSDIFIFAECIRQVKLFKPWADTFESRMVDDEKLATQVAAEWEESFKALNKLAEFFPKQSTCHIGAELFHMKYPVEKKRTKANVEAMQAAEAKLDTFWTQVIAQLDKAGLLKGRLGKVLSRPDPERTQDWAEPPKKQIKSDTAQPLAERPVNVTSSSLLPGDQPSKILPLHPKEKAKTRGVARSPPTALGGDDEDLPTTAAAAAPPEQTFHVDKRALKVFSMLYYQPSTVSPPGEIPWLDFLYAMYQVGFTCEKLGGSAWQFTPGPKLSLSGDGCLYVRGIQFHEPHPTAKIPFRMARMYGRRLARAYGWAGATFRAAE